MGLLFVVMAGGFALYAYFSSVTQSKTLTTEIRTGGLRAADVVARSADYAMLQNRRDLLTRMIGDVGTEPGIEVVRIYNKHGVIALSSDTTEQGHIVDMLAEACNVCHSPGGVVTELVDANRSRVIESDGERSLGVIRPIYNRADCSGPPCHAHSVDQSVLGLLEVRMSLAGVDEMLSHNRWQVIGMGAVLTLLVAGFAGLFVHRVVHRPILNLTAGTREIAAGNLDIRLSLQGGVELESLARDFNHMAESLAEARAKESQWSDTLEQRVQEKTSELENLYARMLQVERMASLGQLAATVAHEINNPLSGVLTYAKLLIRRAEKRGDPPSEELSFIASETQRCGEIVKNLLGFSRRGIGKVTDHRIDELVDQALQVIGHHLELRSVQVTREIEPCYVPCDDAQIKQALVAMFVNAIEAMPDGGELTIRARAVEGDQIRLEIVDTGIGIDPEDARHIFEPFYTSKRDGKGVGLGLAVVYGIVSRHGGTIEVESRQGKGTVFVIHLPSVHLASESQKENSHV
jgi:two-component system NtrC family sensor kinase